MKKIHLLLIFCLTWFLPGVVAGMDTDSQPTGVPASLKLDSFYKKYMDADGIPVISSGQVRDEALVRAKKVITQMLSKRPDIRKVMVDRACSVILVGAKEEICEIPQYAHICDTPENIAFWNKRARGFGGAPEDDLSSSCGEENVLGLPGDRYEGESILVHEFAHIVHLVGIVGIHPEFNDELENLYQQAISKGLWKNTYALSNKEEYFAETVQSFFNCNRYSETPNGIHNSINTREKLKNYDPEMYRMLLQYLPEIELELVAVNFGAKPKQSFQWNTPQAGNPIIPGYFADPTIRKFGDMYYLYCTTDGTAGGLGPSQVWMSKDFVNWSIQPMNWPTTRQIWAPDVMQGVDGHYYFYYSQACKIYCAVSDSPVGPWKNIFGSDEAVLIPDRYVSMAITLDAQSFVDDDGSTYLYWGTWGIYPNHGCGVGKLNPDMKSFADTTLIPNTQATDYFEAPYIFKRNGIYYLTYSSGSCHDHTYRVQYATSKTSPMGPFEFADNNPILETNADSTIHGPGHHSILQEGDDYYIVYHRHNIPQSTRGFHRQIAADRLTFDKAGRINKIDAGHQGIGFLQQDKNPSRNLVLDKKVKASSFYNEFFQPEYAIDDNNATLWRAKGLPEAGAKEWIEIDLGEIQPVKRIRTQFEHATAFYQYLYETSTDGKKWKTFADKRNNTLAGSPMIEQGNAGARYIRLTITGCEKNGFIPAVWNIQVFSDGIDPFVTNKQAFNGQAIVSAEKRKGLLFEVNADNYPQNVLLGRIQDEQNKNQGFDAKGMPVLIASFNGKSAFVFNGRQQFVSDFGLPATIAGNAPYSISAWIASPNPKANECIIDLNESWQELSKIVLGYGTSPQSGITMHYGWYEDMGLAEMKSGNDWHHVVVTFDGYKEKIYIDGTFMKEKDIFLAINECKKLTLGVKSDGEHPFGGYLHSLRVYDTVLSEDDIKNNK